MNSDTWKRCLGPIGAAIALHLVVLLGFLAAPRIHGDLSALVCVPDEKVARGPFEQIHVGFGSRGYDGQYCYALARDPWRPHSPDSVAPPAYRHLRLLYPMICWALTAGNPAELLWAMPLVNLLAIAALASLGSFFALQCGRSPWWGLLLPLFTHSGLPLLRDLTDLLGTLGAFGLIVAWLRKWHPGWLALWAVFAIFAREQNLAIIGIVGFLAVLKRDWRRALSLIPACVLWLSWLAILQRWYGESPLVTGNFGLPFAAFVQRLSMPFDQSGKIPTHGLAMVWISLQLLLCLTIPFFKSNWLVKLVALAGAALIAVAGWPIYEHWYGSLRVFTWAPLAIWIWAVQSGRSWPAWLTLLALPWPLLAVIGAWR